jgi:hypothetical protein
MNVPAIRRLKIERFRCIQHFTWHPANGCQRPPGRRRRRQDDDSGCYRPATEFDQPGHPLRYRLPRAWGRGGFCDRSGCTTSAPDRDQSSGEAVLALGVGWHGHQGAGHRQRSGEPVYRLRVSGTEDLELLYEIAQPDGTTDSLPVALRRSIGLLFRWQTGCLEENIINALPDDKHEALLTGPEDSKTGIRLRTLQERLGTPDKTFATITTAAGANLRTVILAAALGEVPADKTDEKKHYHGHSQSWFKSVNGGRELAVKVFTLGIWDKLKPELLPFCNAVRKAVDLDEVVDLPK